MNLKIRIPLIFICVLLIPFSLNFNVFASPPPELICSFTKKPVTIDGHINSKEWKNAGSIIISDKNKITDNTAVIRTLWDYDNLYLAFEVSDNNLQAEQYVPDHPRLWLDDMIEFLFDTRNDKDSCWNVDDIIYHINLLGQKKDDRGTHECQSNAMWNGSARYVVRMNGTLNDTTDVDTGYIIEIAVSWQELELSPYPGLIIGANFAVGDKGAAFFDWVGADPFRSPYAFGNLILKK